MGLWLQLLAERHQHWGHRVLVRVGIDMVHRVREEPACTTGWIVEGPNQAGVGLKKLVVRIEQKSGRQMNHVPWGHKVLSPLVDGSAKPANEVLVHVAHDPVGHH